LIALVALLSPVYAAATSYDFVSGAMKSSVENYSLTNSMTNRSLLVEAPRVSLYQLVLANDYQATPSLYSKPGQTGAKNPISSYPGAKEVLSDRAMTGILRLYRKPTLATELSHKTEGEYLVVPQL